MVKYPHSKFYDGSRVFFVITVGVMEKFQFRFDTVPF